MDRKQKSPPRKRPASTGGKPGREAKATPESEADPGAEARGSGLHEEFLALGVRLHVDLNRRLDEALRENADFRFSLDFDREIRDVKEYNAAISKTISVLKDLKKANNARLDDLKWLRDNLDPTSPGFHEP